MVIKNYHTNKNRKKLKNFFNQINIIAMKKIISDKEKESLWQKLELKIQELISYINAIYYETLYNHITKRHTAAVYIFDKDGIIPQAKRTRSLPKPV